MTATNELFTDVGPVVHPSDEPEARDAVVTHLNSLLRGEIAAAETYKQAIDKVADRATATGEAKVLRQIQEEHGRAAQGIRDRIRQLGGEAADSSGAWGMWAGVITGAMGLIGGESGALKALKEGEEHGLKDYREAAPDVDGLTTQLIENQLIPAQQRHINLLDHMLVTATKA